MRSPAMAVVNMQFPSRRIDSKEVINGRTQLRCKDQMEGAQEKFCERMDHYLAQPEKNMIFTEDLKSMIHLAETDKDVDLVMRMMKQFNSQNKEMRFGSFTFGPVVMRMFLLTQETLEALEAMKSPELEGFFDQVSSFFILMDLLYKHELYQEVLDTYQLLRGRELERARYPRDCIILCSPPATAWTRPLRRRPALESSSRWREVNYITTRNLKLIALADLDRVDEALPALAEGDHVAKVDIAEIVTTPILERRPPPQQRQDYQPSGAYNQRYRSQAVGRVTMIASSMTRPGLSDRYDT
ncbi:PREDICTED: uncharacterized protein LOC106805710 [Priapulus caudatus]|uniref:Uncharacterized protein LOC106805710 n=1 Tax=Priapulus caudatus TaxID=37621 RepID=A0ABM1DSH8_PRICU|nr:PREDICTED: uncharacterized protein LOC106805710 [Priapulus caudatus]